MITGLQHLHSSLPYLLLPLLLLACAAFWYKRSKHMGFTKADKKLALIPLILTHLQFILGLALYFLGDKGYKLTQVDGFMKNSQMRLYAVEHISVMILAIALVTIGYSSAKRAGNDSAKFKRLGLFFTLGLILMLSRIPWNVWLS